MNSRQVEMTTQSEEVPFASMYLQGDHNHDDENQTRLSIDRAKEQNEISFPAHEMSNSIAQEDISDVESQLRQEPPEMTAAP